MAFNAFKFVYYFWGDNVATVKYVQFMVLHVCICICYNLGIKKSNFSQRIENTYILLNLIDMFLGNGNLILPIKLKLWLIMDTIVDLTNFSDYKI